MKPQALKVPYFWEERRPYLKENVLHIPRYYFDHQKFSMPSWEELFGNTSPIFCELCSGNGDWIVAQALENPNSNWIAVEKRFDRVRKIWSKMCNSGVNNLKIVNGEAQTFFRYYVGSEAFQKIIVNFPDPWPKLRHRKHRLFQAPFMEDVIRVLQASGMLVLVTDDIHYLGEAIETIKKSMSPTIEAPHYYKMSENYGNSWFEKLWRSKGQEILYTEFKKNWDIADLNS
ncbi:methyltransferase family protein [Chlamydia ibidis 10-1398/6]|uniref:tRNA (guanine-N(7)-)-methyltransferase n=1 Tax=Chlamydia ibidis 10-1398/6 TaxID=1046581 RepID=A0ABP2XD08_9CHLA|nr:tRNA (guanine(46)-N(7))-methyltransferase TrmB [Chlamydia ibidis]EQM62333.1 methyltransferase family protein [Chlamydia ibidis 10-1398/6]